MSSWAAVSDVQARLTYATISASSSPSTTQVQAFLDEGEAFLRGALRAAGLPTTHTDTDAVNILTSLATDYAVGLVQQSWASADGTDDNEAGLALLNRFHDALNRIRRFPVEFGAELNASGNVSDSVHRFRSYVTDNDDSLTVDNGDFDPIISDTEVF